MAGQPIVIHVPKTGGTTLVMAITRGQAPPTPGDQYRHVHFSDDRSVVHSNCGDIFADGGEKTYAGRTIVLTVRQPLDRLESEFGFLSNRDEFRSVWQRRTGIVFPTRLIEFVDHDANTDSLCKFLLGRDLYDDTPVTRDDVQGLITRLDELDFVFGLTHEMPATVQNIAHHCDIEFDDVLRRHRTSVYKAARGDDWAEIESLFAKRSAGDLALYDAVVDRFQKQIAELPEAPQCRFVGGAYESLLRYCSAAQRRAPLELYANDVSDQGAFFAWVEAHREALLQITATAMQASPQNGRGFVKAWLRDAIPRFLPDNETLVLDVENPLTTLRQMATIIASSDG